LRFDSYRITAFDMWAFTIVSKLPEFYRSGAAAPVPDSGVRTWLLVELNFDRELYPFGQGLSPQNWIPF
jgi:hypothetical protein